MHGEVLAGFGAVDGAVGRVGGRVAPTFEAGADGSKVTVDQQIRVPRYYLGTDEDRQP